MFIRMIEYETVSLLALTSTKRAQVRCNGHGIEKEGKKMEGNLKNECLRSVLGSYVRGANDVATDQGRVCSAVCNPVLC